MSQTVYLIRHGTAESNHPHGDHARNLTSEGRARFEAHVRTLRAELAISRVLCSPLVRARQTGEVLAGALGAALELAEELSSGRLDGGELLELARRAGTGTALVGHNPEMADAVMRAAGHAHAVAPGTVAAVAFEAGSPRLSWCRSP